MWKVPLLEVPTCAETQHAILKLPGRLVHEAGLDWVDRLRPGTPAPLSEEGVAPARLQLSWRKRRLRRSAPGTSGACGACCACCGARCGACCGAC